MMVLDDYFEEPYSYLGIEDFCNEFITRKSPMNDKNFHDGYTHYSTLDEAVKGASRRATKSAIDVTIYQAVKKVSPKTPEVDVTDITV